MTLSWLRMLKTELYLRSQEWRGLFRYPATDFSKTMEVDYGAYWDKRRGAERINKISSWQQERMELILPHLKPGSRVLDVGCGDGACLTFLGSRVDGLSLYGLDIDGPAIEQAQSQGIIMIAGDLADPAVLASLPEVDYIIAFEILEHLPCPERVLRLLTTKARQGVFLSVPNTGYYTHRLRLLLGRFPLQWITHPGEHLRFWTVKDMRWWLGALGLQVQKYWLYRGVLGLRTLWPSLFGQGMIFWVKK